MINPSSVLLMMYTITLKFLTTALPKLNPDAAEKVIQLLAKCFPNIWQIEQAGTVSSSAHIIKF